MTSLQFIPEYGESQFILYKYLNLGKSKMNLKDLTIKKENTLTLNQFIDEFTYPSLNVLHKQFLDSGLYTKTEVDRIIKVYGRLPKYKTQCSDTARSRERSKKT